MVDFINEVEEELRKDEYNRYLKRYGPFIGIALALLIAGVGFNEWRERSNEMTARAMSLDYTAAADLEEGGDVLGAVSAFEALSEKAPEGYAGLALIRAATLKLDAGEDIEAVKYLDRAAQQFTMPRHKQLAQMKAAYILTNEGAYTDVMERVRPLTEKDAPYEFLARELLGLAALKTGNEDLAKEQYGYLSSIPGVPEKIKDRADAALAMIRVDAALRAKDNPVIETPAVDTSDDDVPVVEAPDVIDDGTQMDETPESSETENGE